MDKYLKTMMDTLSIKDITQEISEFIHSGDGYENKLKLTLVILHLIEESCMLLKTIDLNDYILEIRKRIEDVESQSNSLKEAYRRHLYSNKDLSSVLACPGDNKVSTLQKEIEKLLGEYDSILKEILKKREELPIEAMLKEQEQR